MDTSPNILLKIDSRNGNCHEVIRLDKFGITKDCQPPKFYKDRIYILDNEKTLHIFEDMENAKCL